MAGHVRGIAGSVDALRAWISRASGASAAEQQSALRRRLDALTGEVNGLTSDPTIRAVLELHRPVVQANSPWPVCAGCDRETPDEECPEWPCTTWTTVEQRLRSEAAAREANAATPGQRPAATTRPANQLRLPDQPKRPEM